MMSLSSARIKSHKAKHRWFASRITASKAACGFVAVVSLGGWCTSGDAPGAVAEPSRSREASNMIQRALEFVVSLGYDPSCYKPTAEKRAPSLLGGDKEFETPNVLLTPVTACPSSYPLRVFDDVSRRADWDLVLMAATPFQLNVLRRAHDVALTSWADTPAMTNSVFLVSEFPESFRIAVYSKSMIEKIKSGWLMSGGSRIVVLRRSDLAVLDKQAE